MSAGAYNGECFKNIEWLQKIVHVICCDMLNISLNDLYLDTFLLLRMTVTKDTKRLL